MGRSTTQFDFDFFGFPKMPLALYCFDSSSPSLQFLFLLFSFSFLFLFSLILLFSSFTARDFSSAFLLVSCSAGGRVEQRRIRAGLILGAAVWALRGGLVGYAVKFRARARGLEQHECPRLGTTDFLLLGSPFFLGRRFSLFSVSVLSSFHSVSSFFPVFFWQRSTAWTGCLWQPWYLRIDVGSERVTAGIGDGFWAAA
jgi:hypothetical protein